MSGRTPAEATHHFLDTAQLLISCISRNVVGVNGGYYPAAEPHALAFLGNRPATMVSNPTSALRLSIWYQLIREMESPSGRWRVQVVAYFYAIENDEGREILTYHWHPAARSPSVEPHLHLESASGVTRARLLGAHLPTGHVTLAQLIRCLIEELGVEPRRADWRIILAESVVPSA